MRMLLALIAAAALFGETPSPGTEPYNASGTEPFWGVGIAGGQISFEMNEDRISVPAPEPVATTTGRRYVTDRLTIDIRPGVCNDGMSDYLYADTVIVVADGRTLNGCGGERVPEDTLAHSTWSIEQIDGQVIDEDEAYVLEFTADRISGRAGCNRFSGIYSRAGDTLTPGALATTRMACPSPHMEHEGRALQVLSGPVRISQASDGDALILTGNGGSIRIYRSWAPWPSL